MSSLYVAVALLVFVSTVSAGLVRGGAGLPTCPANSPDLNSCVRTAIQTLVPYLAGGIPAIGAAPTDPLNKLPPLVYSRPTGDFHYQMDNIVIKGLANGIIDGVQVDLPGNTIRIQAHVPAPLVVEGDHVTNGNIGGVPLTGAGFYRLTTSTASVDVTLRGQPVTGPDGQIYLQVTSAAASLDVGAPILEVDGLFGNFPPLNHAAHAFINSVSGSVLAEMDSTLEAWLSSIFLERGSAVFGTVPLDTIFPGRSPAAFGLVRAIYPHY